MKYFSIIFLAIIIVAGCKKKESDSKPLSNEQRTLISHKWYYKEVTNRAKNEIDSAKTACWQNCYITFSDIGGKEANSGVGIAHYENSACTPYAPFKFKYILQAEGMSKYLTRLGICQLNKPYNLDSSYLSYYPYSFRIYGDTVFYLQDPFSIFDYKFVAQ